MKRTTRCPLIAFAGVLLLAQWAALHAAERRDLILAGGQSNAVGFDAYAKELPSDPGAALPRPCCKRKGKRRRSDHPGSTMLPSATERGTMTLTREDRMLRTIRRETVDSLPSQEIMPDVPVENIVALVETVVRQRSPSS